ncbi:MAG: ATP-binding protein, partial [Deltaproteobacteria bacterium]
TEGATYREAAAQLVLMAFLHRVVNGGGTVTREYGIASRRIDLLVTWPWTDASGKRHLQREAIELKVWRDGRKDPLAEGLKQLDAYLDRTGLGEGVLVLFDRRREAAPLEDRTREESAVTATGKPVRVLRA